MVFQAKSVGRGGVGNILARSRARAAAIIPEGFPQTAFIVSENAAHFAAYERQIIEGSQKSHSMVGVLLSLLMAHCFCSALHSYLRSNFLFG